MLAAASTDATVVDVVTLTHRALRAATECHQGRFIKTVGRGVFSTFPDSGEAALAAARMHRSLRENQLPSTAPLLIMLLLRPLSSFEIPLIFLFDLSLLTPFTFKKPYFPANFTLAEN